ncbi:hypothetical protein [Anaerofustis butyriciformans]|uniref:hypothetical protein n=1 Tax=Anaerofustis butyriciformans TaxID=3108533 RepID=UPI003F89BF2B
MSNKKDKYGINSKTYVSGGRAMGNSGSAIGGGLKSAFSRVKSTSNKENTSSNKSSSGGVSGLIKSSVGSTVTSNKSSNSYDSSSKSNNNLDYNVKKYMGQRGGTFEDKSYTKIGDDFYLKANPYSGIDMKKNNKPTLLKENQYNISEENREKINKGKIESYIKGINPYSAPPKNIRDAKAKESVESLMNSIQKKKNTIFKNQSEDNERGITERGISQVTSNIKPYGMDQRSAVNTKNNSLYQAYPGYGSRVTSSDIQRINDNANNFVKQRDEKAVLRKQIQANKEKMSNTVNSVMSNYYKPYNESNNVKINTGYPAYGSRVTNEDIQRINADSQSFVDRNKADFQAGQAIKAQKEEAKKAAQEKKANAKPVDNLSDVINYYYVQNGNFDKDKFNQQMTDYKSYLTEKENLKKQNKTKEAEELEKQNEANVNDLLYSNNSVPGQPTSGNFTKEHLGKAVPEYKTQEDINKELTTVESEYSTLPEEEVQKYINKADSIAVNDTNAGSYYDDNPYASFQKNSKYNKTGNEEDKTGYDYMTEDEISTAKYILGRYGKEAQREYLKNLKGRLVEREATDYIIRELSGASPAKLRWESYKAGALGKFRDIFQTGSVMGGNNNLLEPSVFETAINRKYEKSSDETQKLMKKWRDAGDTTVSIGANAINPVLGNAIDITSDYGDSYTDSLRDSSQTITDAKNAEKTAFINAGKKALISKGIDIPNSALKKQIGKKYGNEIDTMLSKGLKGNKLNEKQLDRKKARFEKVYDSLVENYISNMIDEKLNKKDKYLY